jgi:hypothetical protein
MRRQLLDPPGTLSVPRVVARLCGVQAQVASSADLAVRVRRRASRPDEVAGALAQGRLVKTWAMRGTLHLLAPENGALFLSIMAAERAWASWGRYFGKSEAQMDALWRTACDLLRGEPLTRAELADAIAARRTVAFAEPAFRSSYGEIMRPLAWRGELCFGPSRDGRITFTSPARATDRWPGLVDADEAAPAVIDAYLAAYGPATVDGLARWLRGAVEKRRLKSWFADATGRLAEVTVDGRPGYVRARDSRELVSTQPTETVRLVPGFDQYVLGAGTEDEHVVPAARRAAVSRQSGWISPVVLAGGKICGTWELKRDEVRVAWFTEAGRPPRSALDGEVARLADLTGRPLRLAVAVV